MSGYRGEVQRLRQLVDNQTMTRSEAEQALVRYFQDRKMILTLVGAGVMLDDPVGWGLGSHTTPPPPPMPPVH
ncbi:MAG: hypothetical protein LC749_01600 [Actinobacteria bacterium]|nr:hypothetical protein [Actinomycetota bacterium]